MRSRYSIKRIKCKNCGQSIAATWMSRHKCGKSLQSSLYVKHLEKEKNEILEAAWIIANDLRAPIGGPDCECENCKKVNNAMSLILKYKKEKDNDSHNRKQNNNI